MDEDQWFVRPLIKRLEIAARSSVDPPLVSWIHTWMNTFRDIAQQFGDWIVQQNYPAAHALLTPEAQAHNTPDDLRASVTRLTEGGTGPIRVARVVEEGIVDDWPAKEVGDVAIVYIALNGDGFAEAVTVTITRRSGSPLIRQLDWGRP